jgi:hypothetical protein
MTPNNVIACSEGGLSRRGLDLFALRLPFPSPQALQREDRSRESKVSK